MKVSKTRLQIAWEAARLIRERPDLRHSDARRMAVKRLCPTGVRPRDIPTDAEVGEQLQAISKAETAPVWELRFDRYAALLRPLEFVTQDPIRHPEGDVLYHSLQVYTLVGEHFPYDEELLTAALLHDVGKAVNRRDSIAVGLAALTGIITPRTVWFIENLPVARTLVDGTLGVRAINRLKASPDFDELTVFIDSDLAGRRCGVVVPDIEEAIDQLSDLSQLHGEDENPGSGAV
ncbi:MAG: HD domain-containing protein [Planctomycetes bacterium]|nr:HD domain-containing protein [Planctomycetota bacterium]